MNGMKIYSLITQLIVQVVVLSFLGIVIGRTIDGEDGIWQGILGVIGGLLALAWFVIVILKLGDNNGRKNRRDSSDEPKD